MGDSLSYFVSCGELTVMASGPLSCKVLNFQLFTGNILNFQHVACKIYNFQLFAGEILNFQHFAGKVNGLYRMIMISK